MEDYDYENDYLDNGVSYEIFDFTKTDENELQTWFGADPTILH